MEHRLLHTGPIQQISREERDSVEKRLEVARNQVQDLVFRLNSTNLAVMLPEELLFEIFKYLTSMSSEKTPLDKLTGLHLISKKDADVYDWIKITHVCKRWRNVALGAPALWTRLRASKSGYVRMSLERSRTMYLDVEGALPKRVSASISRAWRLVFKQSHRIRSLKFDYAYDNTVDTAEWLETIRPEFPELKTLLVRLDPDEAWELPPMFQKLHDNPTLETLRAYELSFRSSCKLFSSNLRHLELHRSEYEGRDYLASVKEMLMALKELPQLQSLRLIESFPRVPLEALFSDMPAFFDELPLVLDRPVDLPHLLFLQLVWDMGALPLALLVRNLALRASATIKIGTEIYSPEDVTMLASLLSTRMCASANDAPPAPLRTLAIHESDSDSSSCTVTIAGWTQELPVTFDHANTKGTHPTFSTPEPCLFEASLYEFDEDMIFGSVVLNLPLESVRCISLDCDESRGNLRATARSSIDVFTKATKVTTLVVQAAWANKLPSILMAFPELFPELHTLHIDGLNPYPSLYDELPGATAHNRWMVVFRTALSFKGTSKRLRQIIITRSDGFSSEDVAVLKKDADEVIWDKGV